MTAPPAVGTLSDVEAVAIVGSRLFPRLDAVAKYLERRVAPGTALISGGAPGVDEAAEEAARARGWRMRMQPSGYGAEPSPGHILVVRPNYRMYAPRVAPLIRNAVIADLCTRMVAFVTPKPRGTLNAIRHAAHMGKPVEVYAYHAGLGQWRVLSGDDFAYRGGYAPNPLQGWVNAA